MDAHLSYFKLIKGVVLRGLIGFANPSNVSLNLSGILVVKLKFKDESKTTSV